MLLQEGFKAVPGWLLDVVHACLGGTHTWHLACVIIVWHWRGGGEVECQRVKGVEAHSFQDPGHGRNKKCVVSMVQPRRAWEYMWLAANKTGLLL